MSEVKKRSIQNPQSNKERLTVSVSVSALSKLDSMVVNTGYARNELVDRLIMDFHETLTRKLK